MPSPDGVLARRRLAFAEQPVAEEGDDGLETVLGADLEDFLAELRGGADGLEADGDFCGGEESEERG
ncbi:MAG: hypothetical protein L6R40_005678 [Gallowayella cf. fulva]|nr:MAG: hypothetical protein L6R40_005678 [Xanthomendoza cf. fulva]